MPITHILVFTRTVQAEGLFTSPAISCNTIWKNSFRYSSTTSNVIIGLNNYKLLRLFLTPVDERSVYKCHRANYISNSWRPVPQAAEDCLRRRTDSCRVKMLFYIRTRRSPFLNYINIYFHSAFFKKRFYSHLLRHPNEGRYLIFLFPGEQRIFRVRNNSLLLQHIDHLGRNELSKYKWWWTKILSITAISEYSSVTWPNRNSQCSKEALKWVNR